MKLIYAEYNMYHNSIDVTTFDGYVLRIDCNVAEDGFCGQLPVLNVP